MSDEDDDIMSWEDIEEILNWSFADDRELLNIWNRAQENFFEEDEPLRYAFSESIKFVRTRGGETPALIAWLKEDT